MELELGAGVEEKCADAMVVDVGIALVVAGVPAAK
jgi:hypothetical protein